MKRAKNKSNIDIIKGYLSGERPFVQVGYNSDMSERKEGETWTDAGGKCWIYKNGRKRRINTPQKINPDIIRLRCKDCDMDMKWGNYLDDKIFPKTGRCYDCNIKFETKLKLENKFEDYEKIKVFNNQKSFCLDLKSKLEETIKYLEAASNDIVYLNEDGSEEIWKDTTKEKVLSDAKNDYKECLDALDRIENQLKALNG